MSANAIEIGARLVSLCNDGKSLDAVDQLYAADVVSIEGRGSDEIPARLEGIEAVRGKSTWWYENHEVHAMEAKGPYCGGREDQFVVHFALDVTPKATGERSQMQEVGIYTIAGGKVVQEEFLYLMG